MPIAWKIVLNIVFFVLYVLIWMNLVNFIYDLILNTLWKTVPLSNDPVHLKIAWITFLLITVITIVFRKYFYYSFAPKPNLLLKREERKGKKEEKFSYTESIKNTEKEVDEKIEKEIEKRIEESKKVSQKESLLEDEKQETKPKLEIYIDKEIK